jgi:hypothetical protein
MQTRNFIKYLKLAKVNKITSFIYLCHLQMSKRLFLSFSALFIFSAFSATYSYSQCADVGIYYWGGSLKTADSSTIIPAAKILADSLNGNTIRFTLACNDDEVYRGTSNCLTGYNLTALASRADFNSLITDPRFSTVIITAYDWASFSDCSTTNFLDTAFYTPANTLAIENEFTDFANYLKTFSTKKFIITNWEADNQCYCGSAYYDPNCPSAPENIAGFTKWMNARASGIKAAAASNVKIGIEFCNIHSLEAAGKPDIIDTVIPYIYSDYYLYSSYESINISPEQTASDIVFIRKKLAGFGKDSNALLFGEMGFGALDWGSDSAAADRLQQIVNVVNKYNIPTAIVWTLIDTPTDFGAYDSNGIITDIGTVVMESVCNTAAVNIVKENGFELSIMPNPNNGIFAIQMESEKLKVESEKPQIEIYNVLGEKVINNYQLVISNPTTINLSNLPDGIYFCRIVTENGELMGSGKFIIER